MCILHLLYYLYLTTFLLLNFTIMSASWNFTSFSGMSMRLPPEESLTIIFDLFSYLILGVFLFLLKDFILWISILFLKDFEEATFLVLAADCGRFYFRDGLGETIPLYSLFLMAALFNNNILSAYWLAISFCFYSFFLCSQVRQPCSHYSFLDFSSKLAFLILIYSRNSCIFFYLNFLS